MDPLKEAVITVGHFNSGNFRATVPDKAQIGATVRSFDSKVLTQLEKEIRRVIEYSLAVSGADYNLEYIHGYPSLYNHPEEVIKVKKVMENYKDEMAPVMGAEDFAYYVNEIPGAFFFVGGSTEELNAVCSHHHSKFDVDEKAMLNLGKVVLGLVNEECVSVKRKGDSVLGSRV